MTRAVQRWFDETALRLGKPTTIGCSVAAATAVVGFVWSSQGRAADAAWGALIANWLFLTGIAMGSAALWAVLLLSSAGWSRPFVPRLARAALGFVPVAAGLLLLIVVGVRAWSPWPHHGVAFFAIRQVGGALVLFWLAGRVVGGEPGSGVDAPGVRPAARAAVFCVVYAIVLSLWSFDFVLALDPYWVSTLIGPHLFMGAALSGAAFVSVVGVVTRAPSEEQRRDLAKLCLVLVIFWGYELWSQYLTIWYGNLPRETGFVFARSQGAWGTIAVVVIALTFIAPFFLLLLDRVKRAPRMLGGIALGVLVGVWLERYLLVVPSLAGGSAGPRAAICLLIGMGSLAGFLLAIARYLPIPSPEQPSMSRGAQAPSGAP
jgi:Ni/Fe-hydrogenase subunit HybB-like protein